MAGLGAGAGAGDREGRVGLRRWTEGGKQRSAAYPWGGDQRGGRIGLAARVFREGAWAGGTRSWTGDRKGRRSSGHVAACSGWGLEREPDRARRGASSGRRVKRASDTARRSEGEEFGRERAPTRASTLQCRSNHSPTAGPSTHRGPGRRYGFASTGKRLHRGDVEFQAHSVSLNSAPHTRLAMSVLQKPLTARPTAPRRRSPGPCPARSRRGDSGLAPRPPGTKDRGARAFDPPAPLCSTGAGPDPSHSPYTPGVASGWDRLSDFLFPGTGIGGAGEGARANQRRDVTRRGRTTKES